MVAVKPVIKILILLENANDKTNIILPSKRKKKKKKKKKKKRIDNLF